MNESEIIASIALTKIRGLGLIGALHLIRGAGDATTVFARRKELKELMPDLNEKVITLLDCPEAIKQATQELAFIKKNKLSCLTFNDERYPSRLRNCPDAPPVLYLQGNANLNSLRMVSMVGTRHCTEYGKKICRKFAEDLRLMAPDVLIVSGLAYGVDINSHRAALANELSTVAVLAHGLDRIYPSLHRQTAMEMCSTGGLLTEFPIGTNPDRQNFVRRNRIVAGICDATIVVESAIKGGSLITADIAESYDRDCFAFPGSVDSEFSKGCNCLIKNNKAALITCAEDFLEAMGWKNSEANGVAPVQRELFVELTDEERLIVNLLKQRGDSQINVLTVAADLPVNKVSVLLFELEMKGVVRALAGGVYQLL